MGKSTWGKERMQIQIVMANLRTAAQQPGEEHCKAVDMQR